MEPMLSARPRLHLGRIVATPGAIEALAKANQDPLQFIIRHIRGDWGEIDPDDVRENEFSLTHRLHLLSAYTTAAGDKLWLITEADRSLTTLLLPQEY
jgi:hypothetical protein